MQKHFLLFHVTKRKLCKYHLKKELLCKYHIGKKQNLLYKFLWRRMKTQTRCESFSVCSSYSELQLFRKFINLSIGAVMRELLLSVALWNSSCNYCSFNLILLILSNFYAFASYPPFRIISSINSSLALLHLTFDHALCDKSAYFIENLLYVKVCPNAFDSACI